MGVKNLVKRIGDRAGNRVAKLAELSLAQVESVQLQREQYLLEEPDPTDEIALQRTERLMAASSIEILVHTFHRLKIFICPCLKMLNMMLPLMFFIIFDTLILRNG